MDKKKACVSLEFISSKRRPVRHNQKIIWLKNIYGFSFADVTTQYDVVKFCWEEYEDSTFTQPTGGFYNYNGEKSSENCKLCFMLGKELFSMDDEIFYMPAENFTNALLAVRK